MNQPYASRCSTCGSSFAPGHRCLQLKSERHPKCAGFYNSWTGEFDCGYHTTIICEDCRYNNRPWGRLDPEAKANQ